MGIMEYFLITMIKIVGLTVFVVVGAVCISVLLHRWRCSQTIFHILSALTVIYILSVAYLTLFSRNSPPDKWIEVGVFKALTYSVDLILKFIKSCFQFLTVRVWMGIERPDINIPYIEEGILNILLFVPFGYLLPTVACGKREWRTWHIVGIGLCVSVLIEIMQLYLSKGAFDLDDLINNTLGAFIGVRLFAKYISPVIYADDVLGQEKKFYSNCGL